MNLWVKRTGQLLVAVLFLMSCEDDSFLLGFRNQNKKFNIRQQVFTLPSTAVLIDSIATDNTFFGDTYRLLVGEYIDPRFGTVHAEAYTQLQPIVFNALEAGAIYDSVSIQLALDYYSYGYASETPSVERFSIHEITEDSLTSYRRYYYNSSTDIDDIDDQVLDYDMFSLGIADSVTTYGTSYPHVSYDTLQKRLLQGGNAQPILFKKRLDNSFGNKLFNLAKNNPDSSFSKNKQFKWEIKGLAFIPVESQMILGLNLTYDAANKYTTKLILHYHTTPTDTLVREFAIRPGSAVSYSKISTDRTGDLAGMTKYSGYAPPSGLRYFQNGSPVITKIDIRSFYDFITGKADGLNDSLTNMVINSAQITMDVEPPPPGMAPPTILQFRIMTGDNDEFKYADSARTGMTDFHIATDENYYLPLGDDQQVATLRYNSSTKKYSGFITLFFQNLFDQKEANRKNGVVNPVQLEYLGLIPITPAPGKTLSRAVILPNSIKLKINYTSPVLPNQ